MDDLSPFAITGALINSALYLASVVAAGLVTGDHQVTVLAILTIGLAYTSYTLHFSGARIANTVGYLSNGLGVCAGILLAIHLALT